MPTIAFVSPKGGAGKTTSAFLLSTALAKLYDVTIIDADPNHPIKTWASSGNAPPRLTVVSDADEDTIIERIEDAAAKTPFVVVDLEGTASKIVIYAITHPADVPNLDKAKLNVWELAHEILERLKSVQGRGQQEQQTIDMAGAA